MAFRQYLTALAILAVASAAIVVRAQPAHDASDEGKLVYKRANCMGCHKWHGNGGGGYGGDALSLRRTQLNREQIIETVGCGRPGTGMPYHLRGAYDSVKCYNMDRAEIGAHIPPEGGTFLRAPEIAAVADYVASHIKGRGDPDYADCVAFFGDGSKVCNIYRPQQAGTRP